MKNVLKQEIEGFWRWYGSLSMKNKSLTYRTEGKLLWAVAETENLCIYIEKVGYVDQSLTLFAHR